MALVKDEKNRLFFSSFLLQSGGDSSNQRSPSARTIFRKHQTILKH